MTLLNTSMNYLTSAQGMTEKLKSLLYRVKNHHPLEIIARPRTKYSSLYVGGDSSPHISPNLVNISENAMYSIYMNSSKRRFD